MNFQEDGIGVMGKRNKQFKPPFSVAFQADDYYGTDVDEVVINIIKRKIHDIDDDMTEAIKSSVNAMKLWANMSNMIEFAYFGDMASILVESKSIINDNNTLVTDKQVVYDNYLDDVMSNVVFHLNDQDDKEMIWYIYRYFESMILFTKMELKNDIGKRTEYIGSLNHAKNIFIHLTSKLTPIFVLLMMRYGPDEEFDKKATAFFAGKIAEDDLKDMCCIPVESKVIKGMSDECIFPFNENRYFGGLNDWKKMLGKYGKYNKALHDYYLLCNIERK